MRTAPIFIKFITALLFVGQLFLQHQGQAQPYFVRTDGPGPSGTSWQEAFSDLQEAIDSAESGDEIWIAAGEYWPTRIFDTDSNGVFEVREKTYYINKNIAILAGFSGHETSSEQRDPVQHKVLLSGDIGIHGDTTGGAYHVMFIDGTSPAGPIDGTCRLDGLTIDYGNSSSSTFPHQAGSALFIRGNLEGYEASPSIQRCVFTKNYGSYGGTVYIDGRNNGMCAPSFSQCMFEGNSTYAAGAVMCNGSLGHASVDFRDCIFRDNYTTYSGGAIWSFNLMGVCSLHVVNCRFEENKSGLGGAIYNYCNRGTSFSSIIGSEFYHNEAQSYGGAILNFDFEGNHISRITNCTFSKNYADHFGGALRNWRASTFLTNCILWDNGDEIDNLGTIETILKNSIIKDDMPNGVISLPAGVSGSENSDLNPQFIEPATPNLRLSQQSPAINAGTIDTSGLNLPEMDLDGFQRVRGRIDLGSFENPFSDCPELIEIGAIYSPMHGIYQAGKCIRLKDGASIMTPNQVVLEATQLELDPTSIFEKGATLEIKLTSCQQ